MPALLNAQSSRPKPLTTAATIAFTLDESVTSPVSEIACPPAWLIAATVLAQAAVCRANPTANYNGAPACNANFVDMFGNIATPVRAPDYTVSLDASYEFRMGNVILEPSVGMNRSDAYAIATTGSAPSTNGTCA